MIMSSPTTHDLIDVSEFNSNLADISSAASHEVQSQAGPSDANAPLRAPTGPKFTSGYSHGHRVMRNPPCPFSGIPSPQTMHRHILHKKEDKKCLSITLMQPPAMPWSPLPSNQNMETRTCFYTGSRVHKLDCGHTVVVARDAEPCAANCKPPMCMISSTSSALPAPYAAPINLVRASTLRILQSHVEFLVDAGDALAQAKFAAHAEILSKVWDAQDKTLAPPKDLISGNFSCALCGTVGMRASRAAAVAKGAPYHCVLVGNDTCDVAIIMELEKGVQPSASSPFGSFNGNLRNQNKVPPLKRLGVANDRGHRRSSAIAGERESAGDVRRRKKDAWQSVVRRREKEVVMGKLREECLMEKLGGMELER
ncbi:hypothetical protein DPSP01_004477 [Paraphaeosphaeria sporulosa]